MKPLLQVLFVATEGAYLAKEGACAVIRREERLLARVPLRELQAVVAIGPVGASPDFLAACARRGVTLSFLTRGGRLRAAVTGFTPGNILLRRAQFRAADDPVRSRALAAAFLQAKLANARLVLARPLRARADKLAPQAVEELRRARRGLKCCSRRIAAGGSLDSLRGLEGEGAARYFRGFPHLLHAPGFIFPGRNRRPPRDPVNALLGFVYSLLAIEARSACEAVGLDPAVGFLHQPRPGRPSLALDLIEEWRPTLADRFALALLNRGQLRPEHFAPHGAGGIRLTPEGLRVVLAAWHRRRAEPVMHHAAGEQVPLAQCLLLQARLLARHLRGEEELYQPFRWK